MSILNVAICGLGRMGKVHYQNISNLSSKFKIHYLFDISDSLQPYYNLPIFHPNLFETKLQQHDITIDLVFICSPTTTHYNLIKTSLDNKCNVFVEKPIAETNEQLIHCYKIANDNNLVLMSGFNRRYDPKIRELKNKYSKIDNKLIEQIMVISRDYPYPDKKFIEISNGIYHDSIIHDIDTICWILNQYPIKVSSIANITSNIGLETGHFDNASTILQFQNGIIATIITSRISNTHDQRIEFMGKEKSLTIHNDHHNRIISFPERYHESYLNEILELYQLITNFNCCSSKIKDSLVSLEQSCKILQIINTCQLSQKLNKTMDISYN